ncbi:response regulator [Echinicola marina]|uniref:hybrid sensor histidine kinase/response regulator transcription factor n=1 Tax=Echinicola marina TaxID=2859768 RepID=UPI001CF68214|nr:two-component regulator propeller domain-containing protein [Echinicola marina]UCS91726.1 response regulator [Echinicola marina]
MKISLIALFIFSFIAVSFAQEDQKESIFEDQNQLTFYLLDVASGLSHNYINSIEQDSLGFIWIATLEGLNRYDGQKFTVYRKRNRIPKKGPADNYIQQIQLNQNNQLLLSTGAGLSIYDPKADLFELKGKNFGLIENNVNCTINTPDGNTAVGIYWGGLQIIDQKKVLYSFFHEPEDKNSLSSNQVNALAFQGDSILWVGTFDNGLNKINYKTKSLQRINSSKIAANINSLFTDDLGNLWIGGNRGIQVITHQGDTLNVQTAASPQNGLSDENVLCFEKDNKGQMWVGTRNGGLNIIDPNKLLNENQLAIQWFLPRNDGASVYNRTVASLKLARDGNMWIGTSTGINVVNPNGDPIQLIQRNLSVSETISHNRIGSLASGKNGSIWIGTDGGGLDHYIPKTGQISHYEHHDTNASSLSNNYILSILEDSKGRVWAGTYQGGLNRLVHRHGEFKQYLQGSQENGNDVRVIFEGKKGQIWVGTNRGGLYRYHPPIDDFDYVRQLGKIDIRDITEDDLGNLWLATFGNGIIRYNYLTGEQEQFNESTVYGFPGNIIFSIQRLDNGDILAGSRYEGLIRLDPNNKTVAVFTQDHGLSNNTINSITRGKDGKIWLGTFRGISFFDPNTNEVGNLNAFNNIQQSEFNIGAALTSDTGLIYFGGNKGINVFSPAALQQQTDNYPLIFTELRLMNNEVNIGSADEKIHLSQDIPYLHQLNLSHDQSLVSLDFVALKFPHGNDISYAYKLEPFHDQWIETSHIGTANLSNIPPGDYVLKVRAHSNSNHFAENQMMIAIAPPFWKTWPAYLIYITILAAMVIGGMKYYADRLKLKNSLLFEKKQRSLEHELNEERARFFTGFSHELKTPLTLIMAPIEDMLLELKNTPQRKRLLLVQKNAQYLLEMINKLLEFRKSELDINKLELKNHYILSPIQQWAEEYQPLAQHRKITLETKFPQEDFVAAIDLEKLHIIVNNLLSNALKYCRPGDKVSLSLKTHADQYEITVSDNGPGIPLENQDRIFNWYYQSGSTNPSQGTGIGLALTKRLVEDHQGHISLVSQAGMGCIFSVTLPLQKLETDTEAIEDAKLNSSTMWSPRLDHQEITIPKPNLDLKEEKKVVLLIDDNPQILSYLDQLLGDNYDLLHAGDGQEGMEKALQYIPDIIISDIMMPVRNGIDLCGELKREKATTHIPVILLSAKDNVESITSGFGEGADEYLTKPFNGQILLSRIKNLLDAKIRLREYYLGELADEHQLNEGQKTAISKEKAFLKRLESHILEQLAEQQTDVDTLSQLMGMSRTSLFRKLKALTGKNINQYVRSVKIKRAAYLIKEENLGVAQAAYEIGFNNPKYFRKLFKEEFGYLPSEISSKKTITD